MYSHNSENNYNNYWLLDFITFVHIFYNKDEFTNFKWAIRGQRLLCKIEIIMIKSWRKISLPLKIRN